MIQLELKSQDCITARCNSLISAMDRQHIPYWITHKLKHAFHSAYGSNLNMQTCLQIRATAATCACAIGVPPTGAQLPCGFPVAGTLLCPSKGPFRAHRVNAAWRNNLNGKDPSKCYGFLWKRCQAKSLPLTPPHLLLTTKWGELNSTWQIHSCISPLHHILSSLTLGQLHLFLVQLRRAHGPNQANGGFDPANPHLPE